MFDFLSQSRSRFDSVELDPDLRTVLQLAHQEAARLRSGSVAAEHLLLAILSSPHSAAALILSSAGLPRTELKARLEAELTADAGGSRQRSRMAPTQWSGRAKQAIVRAVDQARELDQSPITSAHLLLAILQDQSSVAAKALTERGVTAAGVRAIVRKGISATVELDLRLDDESDRLIYEQIVSQIQEAIATGRLLPGQRLPPIRQLADQLEIAPGTVARAYAQLESAGTLTTDRARGTFVASPPEAAPEERLAAVREALRPVVVSAFHLGATAKELERALAETMADIYPKPA
jgi:DNA-binding transcriptional regulator YhcF (GntR family)